ncbi:MAG TPA: hypothetical protein VJK54_03860, partial [Chthoniobacterales bacterium]|nr:hypothetical protein [Chthoniobacterales bacterium]
ASKEEAEWAAAAQAAEYSKGKIERAFEKAEREIDEAKSTSDEAKRNVRELEKAPKPVSAAEQAIAAANLAYEKAYAAHAASDYKAKKLAGELTEARVETANAVLHAITVRKGTQHAAEAEAGLEIAKEAELEALKAVETAKVDVTAKAILMSSAEVNLNEAKKTAIGTSVTNPAPPMTAAQKVAMREIEEDKAIAEAAKSKAKKAELTANVAKDKIYEMNFERELKAYHNAEDAWKEAIVGYKTALAKVHEVDLDDEELEAALASAEVHQVTWRAHARWVKARQANQIIATSGASLDHLTAAERAWTNVVEGYKMAVEKAMQAKLKCVELMTSLNSAVSAQESAQAQAIAFANSVLRVQESTQAEAIAFATTKAAQAREQATAAKVASEAALKKYQTSESDEWNRVVVKAEQAAKNWQKVSETLTQGKLERAALWRKAAEQSEISAEEWKQYIIPSYTVVDGDECTEEKMNTIASRLKTARIANCLSDNMTSIANSEEIANGGNQFLAALWSKAAEQNQEFAEYLRKTGDCCYMRCDPLKEAALALEKATIATENKNESLAMLWSKVVMRNQESIEYFSKKGDAKLKGNDDKVTPSYYAGCDIIESAWMLELAAEAFEKETIAKAGKNKLLAELWSKSAAQHQEAAEYYRKAAEARLRENNPEENRWGKVASFVEKSSLGLKSAAEAFEKMTEVTAKGNKTLAELWSKTVEQFQETAEYYRKAAAAKLRENDVEAEHWKEIATSANSTLYELDSAVKALENATTATVKGNKPLAELWSKSAAQYQKKVEYNRRTAEAKLSKNKEEADRWNNVTTSAQDSAWQLELAAEALEKAIEATAKGNQSLAELWNKTTAQYQEAAEHYRKSTEARLSGNNTEADRWEEKASSTQENADELQQEAEELEE